METNLQEKHSIYFDGTSYYVSSVTDSLEPDTEVVFTSSNLELCNSKCDSLNESI